MIKNISYGSVIKMTERKFNIPLILLAAASFAIVFFGLPVEGMVLALITIIISVKLRKKYLIKIPIAVCIVTIAVAGALIAFMIYTGTKGSYNSYWLMQLIFGRIE